MNIKKNLLVMLFFVTLLTSAQDVIYKNDKKEIKSKIIEVLDNEIKYKKFEFLDGPTYSMPKTEIYMIIYKNGQKEMFENKLLSAKEEVKETNVTSNEKKTIANSKSNDTPPAKTKSEFALTKGIYGVLDVGVTINDFSAYDIPNIVVTGDAFFFKNIGTQVYLSSNTLTVKTIYADVKSFNTFYGVRGNYFLNEVLKLNTDKFNLFGGVTFGLSNSSITVSPNSSLAKSSSESVSDFSYFFQVGGRYFFSKKIGIKAEVQFEKGATNIMVGASFRVIPKKI